MSDNMSTNEVLRWYDRGLAKMENNLRIETIVNKVLNLDIYNREMQELNIGTMERIKYHHHKVITIDTDTSGYDTDEADGENAADDCEHAECHRIECKLDPERMKQAKDLWHNIPEQVLDRLKNAAANNTSSIAPEE